MSLAAASLLLALAGGQAQPRVVEVPDAKAGAVVVQVWAKADLTGPRDRAAWQVLGKTLLRGTSTFNDLDLVKYGSQAGRRPTVTTTADLIKIEVWMPPDGLRLAVNMAGSLAVEANLRDDDLDEAKAALAYPQDHWSLAMDPWLMDASRLHNDDVRALYNRSFQPSKLVVVVGGAIEEGKGAKEVVDRFGILSMPPGAKPRVDVSDKILKATGGAYGVHALFGKPVTPATPGAPAEMLALVAAGVGKDCTLYQVLREQKGLCYEVGGVLWPTASGWSPRLVAFRSSTAAPKGLAMTAEVASALLDDSAKWDEHTLARAKTIARLALYGQYSPSPFALMPGREMGSSLIDRCEWEGYWRLVAGTAFPREAVVQFFDHVDLDQLKAAAQKLARESELVTVAAGY